jgi:hypothetical protein
LTIYTMELSRLARLLASPRCVRCALPPASGAPSLRTHSAFRRFGSATGAATPTARQIELAAFREELRCASPVDGRVVVDTHSNRHVATLTFDNAAARNALTGRMMAQLGDAVQQLRSFADAGGVGLVICELCVASDGAASSPVIAHGMWRYVGVCLCM